MRVILEFSRIWTTDTFLLNIRPAAIVRGIMACLLISFNSGSAALGVVVRYLDTKINLLRCQGAELHLQVTLDRVVAIIRRGDSPTNWRGRVDTRPSSSRRRTGARARSREG